MKKTIIAIACLAMLNGCARNASQSQYLASEVGQAVELESAKVLSVRKIKIQRAPTGAGGLGGVTAGAVAGAQFGKGDGKLATAIGGMIIGALIGSAIESEIGNEQGYQYTIRTTKGKTKTITQNQDADDVVFKAGDRVLVQVSGSYQRVIPAN